MKIISLNVNGINASFKKGLLDFINKENPDILCLQEIKTTEKRIPTKLVDIPNYNNYFFPRQGGYWGGVATYTKIKPKKSQKRF